MVYIMLNFTSCYPQQVYTLEALLFELFTSLYTLSTGFIFTSPMPVDNFMY